MYKIFLVLVLIWCLVEGKKKKKLSKEERNRILIGPVDNSFASWAGLDGYPPRYMRVSEEDYTKRLVYNAEPEYLHEMIGAECLDRWSSEKCRDIIGTDKASLCSVSVGGDRNIQRNCQVTCRLCKEGSPVKIGSIGTVQVNDGDPGEIKKTRDVITDTYKYLKYEVLVEDRFEEFIEDCVNRHKQCSFWSSIGECEVSQPYLHNNCALACKVCDRPVDSEHIVDAY